MLVQLQASLLLLATLAHLTEQAVLPELRGINHLYFGCFEEDAINNWGTSGQDFNTVLTDGKVMTASLCLELCTRRGFKYSGVQNGKECKCSGNLIDKSKQTDEGVCNIPCPGDKKEKCGGPTSTNVYATGTQGGVDGSLLGCYEKAPGDTWWGKHFSASGSNSNFFFKNDDHVTCWDVCYTSGFNYAGIEKWFECWCGSNPPTKSQLTDSPDCIMSCPDNAGKNCGKENRIQVFKLREYIGKPSRNRTRPSTPPPSGTTPPPPPPPLPPTPPPANQPGGVSVEATQDVCEYSSTIVNGKRVCQKSVVYYEIFTKLNKNRWRHEIKISPKPDYEFTVFDAKPENVYISNGALCLKPTVYNETFVENGQIKLKGCTGDVYDGECSQKSDIQILTPTQSARITTKQKFSFQYGIVEVQAKMPIGDWISADISLMPADNAYGSFYQSGKIRVMSRGNLALKIPHDEERECGCKTVEGSVMIGYGTDVKNKSVYYTQSNCWRDTFHNFTIVWTPDDIFFLVDGENRQSIRQNAYSTRLTDTLGWSNDIKTWSGGSIIAPFDRPFYISFGVSVGGIRDFEDGSINNGKAKPWKNTDPRAATRFWNDRALWMPTWKKGSSLEIRSIKVTAL